MKKIYLFITLTICAFQSNAQYTVTTSNNPIIGETNTTYLADTAGVSIGTSGASQVWNYTGIVIQATTTPVTNTYVATSAAPNYTDFPGANIAQTDGSGDYTMWQYTTSGAYLYGVATPTLSLVYSNPETLYTIPFTYGFTSNDNFASTFTISGAPATRNGTVTTVGEGYGTLNMPGGISYNNVLKIKLQQQITDVVPSFSYTATEFSNTYLYISSVSKNALLSITKSSSTVTTTSATVSSSKSVEVNSITIAGIKENKKEANFSLYPNPTNNSEISLFYVVTNPESYEVSISNTFGQIIKSYNIGNQSAGMYSETINLDGLAKGMYFVKLKGKESEGTQKIIIQ